LQKLKNVQKKEWVNRMSEIKLKPCPFCGCSQLRVDIGLNDGAQISCPKCGIHTEYIKNENDSMEFSRITEYGEIAYICHRKRKGIDLAVEIWNRRAE
jgi:transcription elongation factor Elf1